MLENKPEQDLSEADKAEAWAAYENDILRKSILFFYFYLIIQIILTNYLLLFFFIFKDTQDNLNVSFNYNRKFISNYCK